MTRLTEPNLFIVGAPKCGTTAWVEYLSRREDVFFADPKEPHFFNTDMPGFRWFNNESDYYALFSGTESSAIRGESSIMYLYSRDAAQNIKDKHPDAKILIFVRKHAAFIASYHQQLLYNRDEAETDLRTAWQLSGRRRDAEMPPHCREPRFVDYKSVGLFSEQISRYREVFDPQQLRIIDFEQWTADPRKTYLDLLTFLGLKDDGVDDFPRVNAAHRHRSAALADLTQRPPSIISAALKQIRRIPGLNDVRPGRWLRQVNRAEGYSAQPETEILREIDEFYREDRAQLDKMIKAQS